MFLDISSSMSEQLVSCSSLIAWCRTESIVVVNFNEDANFLMQWNNSFKESLLLDLTSVYPFKISVILKALKLDMHKIMEV